MTIARARRITSAGITAVVWVGLALWLSGCSAAQNARVVADGQLFCAKATATGPLVVALADAAGAPTIVTGMTAQVVAADCAVIQAIPVAPPANPAAAPVVAAVLPAKTASLP